MDQGDPNELFELSELIGEGSYGVVYKGVERATGDRVAVKIMPNDDQTSLKELQLEIGIMKEAECPFIVGYRGCYVTDEEYWIVMEVCEGGSCLDLMEASTEVGPKDGVADLSPLTELEIRAILASAALGLRYLHNKHEIHRDVKAGNILLTTDGTAKLADFGVSAQLTYTLQKRNTVIGSPFWMAPEVIQETNYDGKADVWSLGITAIEMADGNPPLHKIHPMRAIFKIPSNPPPTLQEPDKWSPEFVNFIQFLLNKKADDRPDINSVLEHQFIKNEVDALLGNSSHPALKALVERTAQTLKTFHVRRNTSNTIKNPLLAERLSAARLKSPKRGGHVEDRTLHRVRLPARRKGAAPEVSPRSARGGRTRPARSKMPGSQGSHWSSQNSSDFDRYDSFQRTDPNNGADSNKRMSSFRNVPLDSKGSMMVVRKGSSDGLDSAQSQNGPETSPEETTGISSALKYFQPKGQSQKAETALLTIKRNIPGKKGGVQPAPCGVIVEDFQNTNNMEFDKQNSIQQQLEILEIQYKRDLQQLHIAYMEKKKKLEAFLDADESIDQI